MNKAVLDLMITSVENVIEGISRYFNPSNHAEQATGYFERGLELLKRERDERFPKKDKSKRIFEKDL